MTHTQKKEDWIRVRNDMIMVASLMLSLGMGQKSILNQNRGWETAVYHAEKKKTNFYAKLFKLKILNEEKKIEIFQ